MKLDGLTFGCSFFIVLDFAAFVIENLFGAEERSSISIW